MKYLIAAGLAVALAWPSLPAFIAIVVLSQTETLEVNCNNESQNLGGDSPETDITPENWARYCA